jgi:hypothetical protein
MMSLQSHVGLRGPGTKEKHKCCKPYQTVDESELMEGPGFRSIVRLTFNLNFEKKN